MEILLIFNPQVTYPELSTLSPELTQKFSNCSINELSMNSAIEASKSMDPSFPRIAIILTRQIPPNIYQSILQSLGSVNCEFILYPEAVQPFTPPKNKIATSKEEIFSKITQYHQKSARPDNPKSIRMIAIKRSDTAEPDKLNWNSLGFNVFRSKDAEFNKQMNTIFFKYKAHKNIKFNQIRNISEIPSVPKQKQFLVVSHMDANAVSSSLQSLDSRNEKVFKILFNTSSKMMNSNQLFDLNVNKISIIRTEMDNYLSKMKEEDSSQKYNESKNNANGNPILSNTNNQNIVTSLKSNDLFRLFILDNNNPKFKQMYQNNQLDGTVISNLQNSEIYNPKTILLAPYQIKDVLLETLNNQNGPNIVLFDSSGGKDITQNSMTSNKIAFVGKTPEQIKGFLKNKVKFNQNKIATGRTVKFIEDPPMLSGTSIDKSLLLNKENNSSFYQQEWTVRRKAATNAFVTYMSHKEEQFMNEPESAPRSMRKMTTKKKTMVNLVEHEPSIKVIESQNIINTGDNASITKIVGNEYYPNNQIQNDINNRIAQNIAANDQAIFNQPQNQRAGEYYQNNTQNNKIGQIGSSVSLPKLVTSSKVIQNDYDQTVISVKKSKLKNNNPKQNQQVENTERVNSIMANQFKPDPISPLPSNIQSNTKQSSIYSDSFNDNSVLNMTSNFGYSPSINSKTQSKNMSLDKNIQISIQPSTISKIKEDKQVIQIMTTKGASSTASTSTKNLAQYKSSAYNVNEEKPIRSTSIDPTFVDHKYQRVIEDGITKYIIKKEYKDQLIKRMLHERDPFQQLQSYNRERIYSFQKPETPKYKIDQYYNDQKIFNVARQPNQYLERPKTLRKVQITPERYKQNYSPFFGQYSPQPSNLYGKTARKNILYIVPNNRQTLIDRVKQIVSKSDTILPYNNQQQLKSFDFQNYKTVILFPKDENKQSLLSKIAPNCYVVKLSRQSKRFNNKEIFVNDIKDIPSTCLSLGNNYSYLSSNTNSQQIVVLPRQLVNIKNSLNHKYQLYGSTDQLYEMLKRLKNQSLIVVIQKQLMVCLDDFEMPLTTKFIGYDSIYMNQHAVISEIKKLSRGY